MHLSTSVVVVAVTGTLIGANLTKREGTASLRIGAERKSFPETHYGFPFLMHSIVHLTEIPSVPVYADDVDDYVERLADDYYQVQDDVIPDCIRICLNVSFGTMILFWTWLICEKWVQRNQPVFS
jgi:hypothetical protein